MAATMRCALSLSMCRSAMARVYLSEGDAALIHFVYDIRTFLEVLGCTPSVAQRQIGELTTGPQSRGLSLRVRSYVLLCIKPKTRIVALVLLQIADGYSTAWTSG